MINLKEIINNCHKYHYIKILPNEIIKYKSYPKKQEINITKNQKLVVIKLKTITKKLYSKEKKSPIKVSGGPLYAEINIFSIVDNIIKRESILRNKVYFPKKYLKEILEKDTCKIIRRDILKICKSYINNKLNNGLIAINTILSLK